MLLKAEPSLKIFPFLSFSTATNYADTQLITPSLLVVLAAKHRAARRSLTFYIPCTCRVLQEPAEQREPLDAPTW